MKPVQATVTKKQGLGEKSPLANIEKNSKISENPLFKTPSSEEPFSTKQIQASNFLTWWRSLSAWRYTEVFERNGSLCQFKIHRVTGKVILKTVKGQIQQIQTNGLALPEDRPKLPGWMEEAGED